MALSLSHRAAVGTFVPCYAKHMSRPSTSDSEFTPSFSFVSICCLMIAGYSPLSSCFLTPDPLSGRINGKISVPGQKRIFQKMN